MRESGRIAAALEVLADFDQRRVPLKVALADWARGARYAGSKDRAFISGLCLDVLRRKASLSALGGGNRVSIAYTLRHFWGRNAETIRDAFAEAPHGPGALESHELELLDHPLADEGVLGADVPEFCWPMWERMSDDPVAEGKACARRAPFDLRVNALKSDRDRVLKALSMYAPEPSAYTLNGVRLPVERAEAKSPQLTVTPAYNKGWMEVQDEGSQIAALAAGDIKGAQVLDFCAGGGGKTLALAAMMENSGQIFAYDSDAARLAPAFERLSRAGVRNAQVISPAENKDRLDDLKGKMDLVFVDAPCSGAGTWRRRPDTKWRLTPEQLAHRMSEQDEVLAQAKDFVAPGGGLVFVTCSLFAEENQDRISEFLRHHPDFDVAGPIAAMREAGGLAQGADTRLQTHICDAGTLRLSPHRTGTDGFGVTRLRRRG